MQKVDFVRRFRIGLFLLFLTLGIIQPLLAEAQAQTKLTVVPKESSWLYSDSGDNLGSIWSGKSYVDDLWTDGQAPLGYGNNIINQNISYGSDEANKIITYYFRKDFIINNPEIFNSMELELLRDDGALIYLNGSPLLSSNLTDDPDYTTLALSAASSEDQTKYLDYSLPSDLLVSGNNVIAVEVHQINQQSSDVIFDLSLKLSSDLPKSVVVSEIMADNHSSYIESDYNQFVDYFELQNISSSVKDLSSYYLSDDPKKPQKWRIPNNTRLDPGAYMVFYADGLDTLMHTSFKLGMKGGSVGLFDWYGRIVDTLNYSQQMTDIAYGRELGNPDQHLYFAEPSPGEDNPDGFVSSERAAVPTFSKQGGVFNSPFSIILSSTSANADIRYTKNGSLPLSDGSHYTAPISIAATTVIKARAFETGKLPSEMVTNSYFINEGIDLPIVSVSLEDKYLSDNDIGIYLDANVAERKPWERPATIELFEPDGSRGFIANVDIRLFGRGAIHLPEKSLGILVRQNDGEKYINYRLFPHMEQDYYESFILRSSSDDWRYTLFRDGMIQSAFQKQTSVDVQSYRASILFLNGKYMGIHNIRDKYNEAYVAARHGVDPDNIDLLYVDNDFAPPNVEIKAGDIGAYKTLIDFVTSNDMSDENNFEYAASLVDIDNFIDYISLQVIT
ncbi:MAG: CotH kinase family protein, partial [Bacteroidales bacterium]|nr:CotH kinase family protein [Bacteroidales bacterium]